MRGEDFYFSRLNSDAQAVYCGILFALTDEQRNNSGSGNIVCRIPQLRYVNLLKEDVSAAVDALTRDHPELFFIIAGNSASYTQHGEILTFRNLSAYTPNQILRIKKLLDRELMLLTAGTTSLDEWDRARIIYTRIAARYKYKNNGECHDYNVVGLLLREEGVCSAYSDMLILALRRVGIACHRVSGGGHAWVLVYLNGIPLHCDVTWESHAGEDSMSYSYFCLTSREISKDHVLPEGIFPTSRFRGYGYHMKNNCLFSSSTDAEKYIRSVLQKGGRIVRLKLDGPEPVETIVRDCIRHMRTGQYRFSVNGKQNTAIIKLLN